VPIVIRLPRDVRSLEAVQSIRLRGTRPVAVGELTSAVTTQEQASVYHKNLQAVTYVTGDLAECDVDGYFWFIGRADDIIKTAGHMVGPFEVESALLEHPAWSKS